MVDMADEHPVQSSSIPLAMYELRTGDPSMGKVIEKVKLTNSLDPTRSVEFEALIDTGATMVAVPVNIIERLGLIRIREAYVRYANNTTERKGIYGGGYIEIQDRGCTLDVIGEVEGSQPLIGQIALQLMDMVVDPGRHRLIPNPESPDLPMVDLLSIGSPDPAYA